MTTQKCTKNSLLRHLSPILLLTISVYAQLSGTEVKMRLVVEQRGGKTGVHTTEFTKQSKAGPGKEFRVFVLARRDCTVSFAGFTRDGQLVYGVPEIVHLQKNILKALPASKKWTFEGTEKLAEIDAVFADPTARDLKAYMDLLNKIGQPEIREEVRQARGNGSMPGCKRILTPKTIRSKTIQSTLVVLSEVNSTVADSEPRK